MIIGFECGILLIEIFKCVLNVIGFVLCISIFIFLYINSWFGIILDIYLNLGLYSFDILKC